jgi:hypothetical protein
MNFERIPAFALKIETRILKESQHLLENSVKIRKAFSK